MIWSLTIRPLGISLAVYENNLGCGLTQWWRMCLACTSPEFDLVYVIAHTYNPQFQRGRWECCEFEASLGYIASSRPTLATQ